MLVNFNHTQALRIVLVQNRLNATGFTGPAVTKEQYVICLTPLHKGFGIFHKALLLQFVANQIVKIYVRSIANGYKFYTIFFVDDAEGFVQTKLAYAISFVEAGHQVKNFVFISSLFNSSTKLLHTLTDIFIVATFTLFNGMVIANDAKAVNAQLFFQRSEVVIKKLFKNCKVALRKLVYTANASTLFFASNAKGIFTAYQKISQVVAPQVGVKPTNGSNVKKLMDLLINAGDELFLLVIASVKFFANVRQREEQVVCVQVAVYN